MKMQKKLQKVYWQEFAILIILSTFNSGWAQPAAGPIFAGSRHTFSVAVQGGYLRGEIFGVENRSPRYLLKGLLSFGDRVNFFGFAGVAKLSLDAGPGTSTSYEDKFRPAYGGGLAIQILRVEALRLAVVGRGQIMRFTSKPSAERSLGSLQPELSQMVQLDYDWREVNSNFGIAKAASFLTLYTGLNLKWIDRRERREDKLIFGQSETTVGRQFGKYRSGLLLSPTLAVDFALPSRLTLSFDLAGSSRKDFTFYIGLSQAGRP